MTDYDIAIVGAGIVGSSLAAALAPHARVLLVDRDVRGLPGSTGHAPGFVGQYNTLAPLTELAKRTVQAYTSIERGFDTVGGLEVALNDADLSALQERCAGAQAAGLEAEMVSPARAAEIAPNFVQADQCVGALHFARDGTANARHLALSFQDRATSSGATTLDADVTSITSSSSGMELETSKGAISAGRVALCTGVWSTQLAPDLAAAVSVAHPYAYSRERAERGRREPFIRWPGKHVYARDHGKVDGVGSYDHDPVHVSAQAMATHLTATGAWDAAFDDPMTRALAMLPETTRAGFADPVVCGEGSGKGDEGKEVAAKADVSRHSAIRDGKAYTFNGLFQVTPDGMPLVGRAAEGVYVAVGVWVTHGAGAAGLLADIVLEDMGKGPAKDGELRKAVDPRRFDGQEDVVRNALRSYNDIYNADQE